MNELKDVRNNNKNTYEVNLIFEIDAATEEAVRSVAFAYDRLGFILKYYKELEDEFIQWQSYVIVNMCFI